MSLRVGEVAAAAGVNVETLRYYERRGLLARPARSSGGHRLYDEHTVVTLRAVKAAQRLGFTLDEAAGLLGVRPRGGPESGLQARAGGKLVELRERIAELQQVAADLEAAVSAGCDDLHACATADCCPIPFLAGPQEEPGPDGNHASRLPS